MKPEETQRPLRPQSGTLPSAETNMETLEPKSHMMSDKHEKDLDSESSSFTEEGRWHSWLFPYEKDIGKEGRVNISNSPFVTLWQQRIITESIHYSLSRQCDCPGNE